MNVFSVGSTKLPQKKIDKNMDKCRRKGMEMKNMRMDEFDDERIIKTYKNEGTSIYKAKIKAIPSLS
ncbi:hypothetical protein BLOT_004175 [Blomia tropicalis]|nr:hypothetical protein BLOT_004175 [Blomia tropicalis]